MFPATAPTADTIIAPINGSIHPSNLPSGDLATVNCGNAFREALSSEFAQSIKAVRVSMDFIGNLNGPGARVDFCDLIITKEPRVNSTDQGLAMLAIALLNKTTQTVRQPPFLVKTQGVLVSTTGEVRSSRHPQEINAYCITIEVGEDIPVPQDQKRSILVFPRMRGDAQALHRAAIDSLSPLYSPQNVLVAIRTAALNKEIKFCQFDPS